MVKAGGALVATCASTLVVNANTSAVSILLPAISEDVGVGAATLQWAVTGYSLVGAAVIVTGGVLGDIAGRRRVFVGALLLFVVSCVLIALAGTGAGVIAGRLLQGAAGSTLVACGLSLLSVATSGPARVRAVSLWGAASAIGAAAGPLAGGALTGSAGWQSLFWIAAAIAAACVPLTVRTVAESRDPDRPRAVDFAGMLLVAGALVPFVLALSEGPDWGWGSAATLGCFAASAAALLGFVAVERRVRAPLVDPRLLRNRVLVAATAAILIVAGALNGLMYVMSLYLQDPAGPAMSPLAAGLATLPAAAGLVVVAPFVSPLATRLGTRTVVTIGFVLTTAGFALLTIRSTAAGYAGFVVPLIAIAVGMGFANGCASSAATAAVPVHEVGAASGISNMARYVGAALLVAATAASYGTAPGAGGLARSAVLLAAVSALGIVLALCYGRHRPSPPGAASRVAAAAGVAHTIPGR
ncbi:MFS transporter [Amycolatopsis sp. YIM 10]|uniref:MFS transporter n=1 Tax=Amycolatopsis sp. YIM 10 TaxID=2653857 RepID=UPI0012901EEC|nr:MFS transporter [Amycolatopsis sp. YIM 10]QFU88939.1 Multidrug resistance protein stp [Amycolatopsis sp. YIM 10]